MKKEQKGWLDITYLSNDLRICRGDKGTLFILRKKSDEKLFKRFQGFIEKIKKKKKKKKKNLASNTKDNF
ncbi:PAP/fibrillin family protein [Prochlorococcus marinus]|uniref:PAP/fibrillin family protein n=1 Tax=Prochlorococcus marinus TaxID=1219 RepID=UPI00316AE978